MDREIVCSILSQIRQLHLWHTIAVYFISNDATFDNVLTCAYIPYVVIPFVFELLICQ